MSEELIIFGCGGVGSWLADFVVRNKVFDVVNLVDFDLVEEKNLVRQNYKQFDIGNTKTSRLRQSLLEITTEEESDSTQILTCNRKITDQLDLTFDKESIAVICTDNVISKRLIAKYFNRFLIVNCDKDLVEVKNFLDDEELKAWDMGGGYSNEQDISSNIYAALVVYRLLKDNSCYFGQKRKLVSKVDSDIYSSFVKVGARGK